LVARNRNCLQLEMSAADRPVNVLVRDDHLRPGLARNRTLRRRDGDENGGLVPFSQLRKVVDPVAHATSVTTFDVADFVLRDAMSSSDRSTASAVAGASSRGDN